MEIILIAAILGIAYLVVTSGAANASTDGSGGTLNASQIRSLAAAAGFSGSNLDTAVAIALAESSGNTAAIGDPTLGVSVGLWQINLKAHPEYTKQQLLDPQANANAAYAVFGDAGSFRPWTTFNTGAYQAYLPSSSQTVVADSASDDSSLADSASDDSSLEDMTQNG